MYFVVSLLLLVLLPRQTRAGTTWPQAGPRTIYQFPPPPVKSYIENLAVRDNGQLLLTNLNPPALFLLDPAQRNPTPKLLYNFTGIATTLTGITQAGRDLFYVAVQNETLGTFAAAPNTTRIFRVCMDGDKATVSLQAYVHAAAFLNSIVTVPGNNGVLLAADSSNGTVVAIDTQSGESAIVLKDPLMKSTSRFPLGINGIAIYKEYLYFTNSGTNIFARMPITMDTRPCRDGRGGGWLGHQKKPCLGVTAAVRAKGPAVQLAAAPSGAIYDDFAMDERGAFIATQSANSVVRLYPSRSSSSWLQTTFAGSNTTTLLDEPTSARFGSGRQKDTLYVVTGGGSGLQSPVAGQPKPPPVIGSQVVAVPLRI